MPSRPYEPNTRFTPLMKKETLVMPDTTPAPALPASTVILLRNANNHLETLLLRRNSRLAFHGGAWVFPGGRIDPEDYPHDTPDDDYAAARQAAVREAQEEAGLTIPADSLLHLAHWTTPVGRPQRFATWFFLAAAGHGDVQVDGGEIHAHRWMCPADALDAQCAGEIELPPPTFVSLLKFAAFGTADEALAHVASHPPETFQPRNHEVPGGVCSLYTEDAGYDTGNLDLPGARHRLWMVDRGWRYERDF